MPAPDGDLVFATDNNHSYTQGNLTKKKLSGRTFTAPANDNPDVGICTGMSIRWIRKSLQKLDDTALEKKIGVNSTAKSAKAQGILESLSPKRDTKWIKELCSIYGLDAFDVIEQDSFEALWGDVRGSLLKPQSQGHYLLLEVPRHMTAMKYGGAELPSRFLDPNHGLYAYDSGNDMIAAVKKWIIANKYDYFNILRFLRVRLSDQAQTATFSDNFVPMIYQEPVKSNDLGLTTTPTKVKTHRRGCTLF
jgi:hypothetical protein